jgi:hypothetical protein
MVSAELVTICVPSGENPKQQTNYQSLCPSTVAPRIPVSESQMETVLLFAPNPVAIHLVSGAKHEELRINVKGLGNIFLG